jgi:hypothetical protein
MVQLAISPLVTGGVSLLVWLVSPLPGIMGIPLGMAFVAGVQIAGIALLTGDRPYALSAPWLVHLAITIGLLPLLATQVSLMREPYVSWAGGTADPALVATGITATFLLVLAAATILRFWREPDQAALVFLPAALLVPLALGQRTEVEVTQALLILGTSMVLSGLVTVTSQVFARGLRVLVPFLSLLVVIALLLGTGRGAQLRPDSGGIVQLLYIAMLIVSVILSAAVPAVSIWLRRASMPASRRTLPDSRRMSDSSQGPY